MNVHDSERMAGMLDDLGYAPHETAEGADVILINTCAVRERPEHKLYSDLGIIRQLKAAKPNLILGVAGCMAQREAQNIRRRVPEVDILLGPRNLHHLPILVRQARGGEQPNGLDLSVDPTPVTPVRRSNSVSAFVNIIFGCNFSCTYCAVPSARGGEVSRRPSEVLDEVRQLSDLGYREITLLGQTVNAYGHDLGRLDDGTRVDFAWLLEQINGINPNLRIRFTSPHPMYFNARLVDAIAALPCVCEHLHLPLQSGDDAVLRRMKRTYTTDKYRGIIESIREKIPDVAVTTDAIAGFCGETDEEFENTLEFFREMQFDQGFLFAYSPRHSTAAFEWPDDVPAAVKKERLNRLIALQQIISRDKNTAQIGRKVEVLVEGTSNKDDTKMAGRSRTGKLVIFPGTPQDYAPGGLVEVETQEGFLWGFTGIAISTVPAATPSRVLMELAVV